MKAITPILLTTLLTAVGCGGATTSTTKGAETASNAPAETTVTTTDSTTASSDTPSPANGVYESAATETPVVDDVSDSVAGTSAPAAPASRRTAKTAIPKGNGTARASGSSSTTDATTATAPRTDSALVTGGSAGPAGAIAAPAGRRADADNTRTNVRDHGGALTPMDQGGSQADRTVTQKIRQAIIADKGLSFNAKNVKIITIGGKVTLRGPVKTDDERSSIETKAKQTPGVVDVDDQLEVKK